VIEGHPIQTEKNMNTQRIELHDKDYLGDGVYIGHDGFALYLRANDPDNPTDEVVIEPAVWRELVRYVDRVANQGR
jgi:hypothetical protein